MKVFSEIYISEVYIVLSQFVNKIIDFILKLFSVIRKRCEINIYLYFLHYFMPQFAYEIMPTCLKHPV